jgi:mRNA interferase RelE/StbE
VSEYTVYVSPAAFKEMKRLPGNVRQRVRRAVDNLADNPHPAKSKALEIPNLACEVRRLRLDKWRIIYAIIEDDEHVDILAIRKRPPYDYGDLASLLQNYPSE